MTALPWIFGAVAGPVLWSAFLRLPAKLAEWLWLPFGKPGRIAMIVTWLLSFAFVAIAIFGAMAGLSFMVGSGSARYLGRRRIGSEIFVASVLGQMAFQVFLRLDQLSNKKARKHGP